jgi:hypothetical protein
LTGKRKQNHVVHREKTSVNKSINPRKDSEAVEMFYKMISHTPFPQ